MSTPQVHKIDFTSYDIGSGRTYLHKNERSEWVYVTRADLYAAYQHQPDREVAINPEEESHY